MSNCGNCYTQYDDRNPLSKWPLSCGHKICLHCVENYNSFCQCKSSARQSIKIMEQMFASLEQEKRDNKRLTQLETKWDNKLEAAEKKLEKFVEQNKKLQAELEDEKSLNEKKKANDVTCSQCGIIEREYRMNICTDCTAKTYKIEVKKGEKIEETKGLDINKLAICSTCVLDNHVGEQHKIVKFYPILAATESNKYLSTFTGFRLKLDKMRKDLDDSKNELFDSLDTTDEQFRSMFEMIKKSTSTEATKQLITAISDQYDKIITTNQLTRDSIKLLATESKKNNAKFKTEKRKLEKDFCGDGKENDDAELIISKKPKIKTRKSR